MEADINKARAKADVVVVSFHWGLHYIPGILADYQSTVGHRAIDAGADLIIGSHPHLIKGIEIYKDKVIFYSLGNFAEETPHHKNRVKGAAAKPMSGIYRRGEPDEGDGARYRGPRDKRYMMMARCLIGGTGIIERISFLPGWINDRAEPRFLTRNEPEFEEVVEYTNKWCRDLGTALTIEGDEVVVCPQAGA